MLVLSITACKKEGCTDPSATNYDEKAKKDDGNCIIPTQDSRTKFIGSYHMVDSVFENNVFDSRLEYVMNITTNNTKRDTIYLNNLANSPASNIALVAGNHFSLLYGGGVQATGSISGNTFTYEFQGGNTTIKGKGTKY